MSSFSEQLEQLAQQLRVSATGLSAAATLLDDGLAGPYIARYEKRATDGLDDRHLRRLYSAWETSKSIAESQAALKELLRSRGQSSERIERQIDECKSPTRLAHWLSVHKRRKLPKAVMEQRRSWYPLALRVLDGEITAEQLPAELEKLAAGHEHLASESAAEELLHDTISEMISFDPCVRRVLSDLIEQSGTVVCSPFVEPESEPTTTDKPGPTTTVPGDVGSPTESESPDTTPTSQADGDPTVAAKSDIDSESPTAATTTLADSVPATPMDETKSAPPTDDKSTSESTAVPTPPADPKNAATSERREKRRTARRQKRTQLESKFKHLIGLTSKLTDLETQQVLELDHGDRVRAVVFDVTCDVAPLQAACTEQLKLTDHPHRALIESLLPDVVKNRLLPELLKEAKRDVCLRAATDLRGPLTHSVRTRALQRPLRTRVLALHSKLRWGWQAAVVEADGTVVSLESIPWNQGADGDELLVKRIRELVSQHKVEVLAIGDSPGARKLDRLFAAAGAADAANELRYVLVDSSGIMEFVRSGLANMMFADQDPHIRAAITVGQRVLDPLEAMLLIPPKDLYAAQPELKTFLLSNEEALTAELNACLCLVGVDVNAAPEAVLVRVPGVDAETAKKIAAERTGSPISSRDNLSKLFADEKLYRQAAGFLNVFDGDNPLDATSVHPEHYECAKIVLKSCDLTLDELAATVKARRAALGQFGDKSVTVGDERWMEQLRAASFQELTQQTGADSQQLKQVLISLRHAGNDIRRNSPGPVIRGKSISLSSLTPGTMLDGTVLNIVKFGAFVDVGHTATGLIHISRLTNGFIRNSRDFVWEGDPIRVWVVSVDEEKDRLALTSVAPGSENTRRSGDQASKPRGPRRPEKSPYKGKRESSRRKTTYVPKQKKPPKVEKPITEEMKDGKEPMRAFSDLLQFYDKKKDKK